AHEGRRRAVVRGVREDLHGDYSHVRGHRHGNAVVLMTEEASIAGVHGDEKGIHDPPRVALDGIYEGGRIPVARDADVTDQSLVLGIRPAPIGAVSYVEQPDQRSQPFRFRPGMLETLVQHVDVVLRRDVVDLDAIEVGALRVATLAVAEDEAEGTA